MKSEERIRQLLLNVYGTEMGREAARRILALIEAFPSPKTDRTGFFSERDVVLITYGDTLQGAGEAPLVTLHRFANSYLKDAISGYLFVRGK